MNTETIPLKYASRPDLSTVRLVKAACVQDDTVYTNWRHFQIMHFMHAKGCRPVQQFYQGFVDQYGNYYSRDMGAVLAFCVGQLNEIKNPLLSEHLWDEQGNPV